MVARTIDRRPAAPIGRGDRRRAVAGFVAATAGLFRAQTAGAADQRKKKRCTFCPQRACCDCTNDFQTATKCALIEASNQTDIQNACDAFCGGHNHVFTVNFKIAGVANVCAASNACAVKTCPIPVK